MSWGTWWRLWEPSCQTSFFRDSGSDILCSFLVWLQTSTSLLGPESVLDLRMSTHDDYSDYNVQHFLQPPCLPVRSHQSLLGSGSSTAAWNSSVSIAEESDAQHLWGVFPSLASPQQLGASFESPGCRFVLQYYSFRALPVICSKVRDLKTRFRAGPSAKAAGSERNVLKEPASSALWGVSFDESPPPLDHHRLRRSTPAQGRMSSWPHEPGPSNLLDVRAKIHRSVQEKQTNLQPGQAGSVWRSVWPDLSHQHQPGLQKTDTHTGKPLTQNQVSWFMWDLIYLEDLKTENNSG